MEDEIIKTLENVTNLRIFPAIARVIIIKLGFIMKKEQFAKFNEWLISKGFSNKTIDGNNETSWLFSILEYDVMRASKRHIARYQHVKDKKVVYVSYIVDDEVTINGIVYFEES